MNMAPLPLDPRASTGRTSQQIVRYSGQLPDPPIVSAIEDFGHFFRDGHELLILIPTRHQAQPDRHASLLDREQGASRQSQSGLTSPQNPGTFSDGACKAVQVPQNKAEDRLTPQPLKGFLVIPEPVLA